MPSLLDAADAFSKLGKHFIEIDEAACVRVRHRHASCDVCSRVCAHEAITAGDNALTIDNTLCTGCGACATACPTEALKTDDETRKTLEATIDEAEPGSVVTIACERANRQQNDHMRKSTLGEDPSKRSVDAPTTSREVFIGCLAAIDESTLIHAACADVSLRYRSTDCARCPNANGILVGDVVEQAIRFLEAFPLEHAANRLSRLVWEILDDRDLHEPRDISPEMSRRGMFDRLVARTTDSVAEAAVGTFYVTQHDAQTRPTLAQSLRESLGDLKHVKVERNVRILDELYRYDPQLAERSAGDDGLEAENILIPTRLFGEVDLDADRCDLCGICMTFCPTAALSGVARPPVNPFVAATREIVLSGELDFRANDCVACGLCRDICPRDALEIRRGIARDDLFALEPKVLLSR